MQRVAAHILAISMLALVAACAMPTTLRPQYSKTELATEQQRQAIAAKAVKSKFDASKKYSEAQIASMAARLDAVATPIENAARGMCLELTDGKGKCRFKVVLAADKKGLNAHADGKSVVIYPAMIDFAKNDDQLAFVLAHEFAHNILQHQKALAQNVATGGILGSLIDIAASSQGLSTGGAFGKLGAQQGQLSYSPEFEHEADYVGLYILARGKFDFAKAPAFWRVMSEANPNAIYLTTTHPTNPARTIEMEKTVQEIHYKQRLNQPLTPNFLPQS